MFSKIMDHKFEIFGAAAIFSGIAGYLLYKHSKNKSITSEKINRKQQLTIQPTFQTLNTSNVLSDTPHRERWSSLYSQFYFDKNLQTRKVLDHLDIEGISIETIYKYSPLIAVNQFKEFTREIKNRRRLIRTENEDQYVKLILEYEKQIDELLERSREEIVYECQIDPDDFQNMKIVFQATQDLTALVRNAKKQLKQLAFLNKRPIQKCILQKIINQELSFIRIKIYDRLKTKLQNDNEITQEEILKIIQALIDDVVFEKYGYEREEIEHAIVNQWNLQLAKDIKELRRARAELESDIGNINLQSQESQNEEETQKDNPSQNLTRSGANSSFCNEEDP